MSDFLERISSLSPKRLALLALELHDKLEAATARAQEPVAIIGLACRFPGGSDDPDAFWNLLREGRDAIGEVPVDRWDIDAWFDPDPDRPAHMSVRNGGFLRDVGSFDAGFFGIAPREALTMDPQHRLLLETSWQALEHAGLAVDALAGSATGVFVGICNSDHFQRVLNRGVDLIDAYIASGNAHSVAAGRIAYCLGLQGPALAVDTACSSSLVALHLAVRSVRSGESKTALAAGVNLMCSPEITVALSKAHMLAPDGRCKTFDASADGFSRGEGCGVLVLKRLSDAIADGDRVLAVIRGSASNQDGRSGGLTVPNGPAQEAVIRAALADAGFQAADIDYVEAHGTGTSLGDPIEVRALAGALGEGRAPEQPLLIGSVKTNIGHLESAAGIAGVIKVVLALQREYLPPQLHFNTPSPHIDWPLYPVQVVAQGRDWPRGPRPRRAGISSFGFSGTNAHVVIEEAPPAAEPARTARPLHCLPLSARTPAALTTLAARYAELLASAPVAEDPAQWARIAQSAALGRTQFNERLVVIAADADGARAQLAAAGSCGTVVPRGSIRPGEPIEVVFMFTGQGAQYPGMAAQLYRDAPVFRDVIDRCDAILGADAAGRTLKQVMLTSSGAADATAAIHETAWTQPALFALECGLARLWQSWGIEPAAVLGHSVGEYSAACVAGVFSLEDGIRLIGARGRLMQSLPEGGAMAAVFAPLDAILPQIAAHPGLSIAAVNAPDNLVISGAAEAVDRLLAELAPRDIQGQRLRVSLAAHSEHVDPALDRMEALARGIPMQAPAVPVVWNLTAGRLPADCTDDGVTPNARYWRRHMREGVRFADSISGLYQDGYRCFLEVGPNPTLLALAQRSLPEDGVLLQHSLRRGRDEWQELLGSVAQLWVRGAPVDWRALEQPYPQRRVDLPGYPFERQTYWIDMATGSSSRAPRRAAANRHPGQPTLLGDRLAVATPTFELLLAPDAPSYLGEHRLFGAALVAGPVFLEMAQAAAAATPGGASLRRAVADFSIHEALILPASGRRVQVQLRPLERGVLQFEVHGEVGGAAEDSPNSSADGRSPWRLHASGRLEPIEAIAPTAAGASPAPDDTDYGEPMSGDGYYIRLAELGIELGDGFRSLVSTRRHVCDPLQMIARLRQPAASVGDPIAWAQPGLLDGALQAVGLTLPSDPDAQGADIYLFTAIERLELLGRLSSDLQVHVKLRGADEPMPAERLADVTLFDDTGDRIGWLEGIVLRRGSRDGLRRVAKQGLSEGGGAAASGLPGHYDVEWQPQAGHAAVPAAAALRAPPLYGETVRERFAGLSQQHGLSIYAQLLPELDRLAAGHVGAALRRMGFDDSPGRIFTAAEEARRLAVLPRHARLFARLLAMLVEDGLLVQQADRFEVLERLPDAVADGGYDALLQRFDPVGGELRTLRRCGRVLDEVLTGRQDPLQLLFPDGSFAEARTLYVESPYARTYNAALAAALQTAIAELPADRPLRILEVGAGTGGTTSYVLPLLAADRTEYTFTDLSALFLERAAETFAAYPFVRYTRLDIEQDPLAQGFAPGRFDLVIAANVLHATADLGQSLRHVHRLMSPGGQLLLLEGVAPERWVDLTFGLTEGWWRFQDLSLRPDYPLVSRDTWTALLPRCGFADVAIVPDQVERMRGAAQQALVMARALAIPQRWTLVDADGAAARIANALERRLRARGDLVTRLPVAALAERELWLPDADHWLYLGASSVDADAIDPVSVASAKSLAVESPLAGLSAMLGQPRAGRAWLVTRGAHAIDGRSAPGARWQAPTWGVGRVFALEQPARWGGLIDLDPHDDDDAAASALIDAVDSPDEEDQIAWRAGVRHVARLRPMAVGAGGGEAVISVRDDSTYLVTGGFGGLGVLIAGWLVDRGARHVALLGRHPDPQHPAVLSLAGKGVQVHCIEADVADPGTMMQAFRQLAESAPPLRGIVHAAAALSEAPIGRLDADQISAMLRPKVDGTLLLEQCALQHPIEFIVLFSSSTALLGASGLAHYAAANLFLDATAQVARPGGPLMLSVNWGTWDEMRAASTQAQRRYREGGLQPMPASAALRALDGLLARGTRRAMVADIDWISLKALHEVRRVRPLLSELGLPEVDGPDAALRSPGGAPAPDPGGSRLAQQFASAPVDMREQMLIEFAQREVIGVLGLPEGSTVPPTVGLFDLGMDSLMAVELRRRFERGIGHPLPSTLTFNYPNVAALARFFESELARRLAPAQSAAANASPQAPADPADDPLVADGSMLDDMSEAELEARLLERLERIK